MQTPMYIILFKVYHAQRKHFRKDMERYNLAPGQPKVLRYIALHPDCKLKDIADACDLKSATVSKTLNNLEQKGLLLRRINPENKRAYRLIVTDSGKEAIIKWDKHCYDSEKLVLKGFTDSEKKQLSDFFCRMYFNLTGKEIE